MIEFLLVFVFLIFLALGYFKFAEKFNIVDKPNHRSSHDALTIRGGGIIFVVSILCWYLNSRLEYSYFFIGFLLISLISFLDDLYTLSSKLRLLFQFLGIGFLYFNLFVLHDLDWIYLLPTFFIVAGFVNAFNFMDGINGITGLYALVTFISLYIINTEVYFVDSEIIVYSIIATIVFLIFNFRTKAKCFAGDIGSVSIAFVISFIMALLILKTNDISYLLLVSIYGIDSVFTILKRLINGEYIFEAHRSHLYQYLANEKGYSHLWVSFFYFITQLIVNAIFIFFLKDLNNPWIILFLGLLILSLIYCFIRIGTERKINL